MNRENFANVINRMAIVYEKEVTNDLLAVYWDIFKDYSDSAFNHAAKTAIKKCKFFPRPSEIMEFLEEPIELIAQKSAGYLINVLNGVGYRNPVGWEEEPTTKVLLKTRFNLQRLYKDSVEEDLKWIEKNFIEAFLTAADYTASNDEFTQIEATNILKAIEEKK